MKMTGVTAIFIGLTEISTRLRQNLWRWVYNKIAQKDTTGQFLFMNYGYDDEASALSLNAEDEPFRYYIQLYDRVLKGLDLANKDVMEVGCGRGGGGGFLLRYKNLHAYTGIDLSYSAIEWCQQELLFSKAKWLQASADKLPIPDNSMDIVVNVESSHCYPSMENFLREVKRVLKLNGYFAFCDLRPTPALQKLESDITASGLNITKYDDITPQVVRALDCVSDVRGKQITAVFPRIFHGAARDFAGIKDTVVYDMLKAGKMRYVCYLLQK